MALDSGRAVTANDDIILRGSRNETLGFSAGVDLNTANPTSFLRITDFVTTSGPSAKFSAADVTWGQVMPVPVDLNRAGYVRQSGVTAASVQSVPRAILPLSPQGGRVALADLRRVDADAPTLLWFDLPIRTQTTPGVYSGAVELVAADGKAILARLPISLTVYDLALPDRRNLQVFGEVTWDELLRHFPDTFEAVTAKLVSRGDTRHQKSVAFFDQLVKITQAHRLSIAVDRLQPTVKWNPFTVDWRDFDALVGPWLDGTAFADKEPLGQWPLPAIDNLDNYAASAQRDYLSNAAAHFDAKDWLDRAPLWLASASDADSGPARQRLLERAAGALSAHPRLRVAVPLEVDALRFADNANPMLPARADDDRLIAAGPGLIYNAPTQTARVRRAPTFVRTDAAGIIARAGVGGDERDVRVWAWLAYVRGASIIHFDHLLPETARDQSADPNALTWFYPGSWFGVDGPVPSLQLKWLRRAEQDFEYLTLADARGERINARLMARLLTRPVQVQPGQSADPIYGLLGGTADQAAWDDGMQLLVRTILLRQPGQEIDPQLRTALDIQTLQWAGPQEKPLIVGRSTLFSPLPDGKVEVRVGVDLYNASDTRPQGTLGFDAAPRGWTINPEPQLIAPLETYQVSRAALAAVIDPDALDPRRRARASMTFTNSNNNRTMPAPLIVPAAVTRRREGNLGIDGSLGDWTDDDALCSGPLVRMLDRPTLQQHTLLEAAIPAKIYSAWSESNVYFAFKVGGLSPPSGQQSAQNFVRYDHRRAWGEDVAQLLVQAVYADGTLGPVLHVACKPNGVQWSERKDDLREGSDTWGELESGARYACTIAKTGEWRGEVAIPWQALQPKNFAAGPDRQPTLLRFNFSQHQQATGTSASWAGPVDFGRDDTFTGVLILK